MLHLGPSCLRLPVAGFGCCHEALSLSLRPRDSYKLSRSPSKLSENSGSVLYLGMAQEFCGIHVTKINCLSIRYLSLTWPKHHSTNGNQHCRESDLCSL